MKLTVLIHIDKLVFRRYAIIDYSIDKYAIEWNLR